MIIVRGDDAKLLSSWARAASAARPHEKAAKVLARQYAASSPDLTKVGLANGFQLLTVAKAPKLSNATTVAKAGGWLTAQEFCDAHNLATSTTPGTRAVTAL
jgi:hypothetical protein